MPKFAKQGWIVKQCQTEVLQKWFRVQSLHLNILQLIRHFHLVFCYNRGGLNLDKF